MVTNMYISHCEMKKAREMDECGWREKKELSTSPKRAILTDATPPVVLLSRKKESLELDGLVFASSLTFNFNILTRRPKTIK